TVPIPTTSWLFALVGTEPRLAGCASTAFSATVELAQYWSPMRPLRTPTWSRTRKGGRPPFGVRVEETREASFGEERHLGQRDLQVIDGQRDRLTVKVASVEDKVVLREERRVIGHRVELDG